jgi:YihY family inner membrane protein
MVIADAFLSFRRNNDLASASSMAFNAMLALIPAMFLLTLILGVAVGSSQEAFRKVQDLVEQVIPSYSQDILKEVRYISQHGRAFGVLNLCIFVLVVVPLVSDLRAALGAVFRIKRSRPFLLEKLIDLGITVVFLLAIAVVALGGIALTVARRYVPLPEPPAYFGNLVQFLFIAGAMTALYAVFSRQARFWHLAAGALAGAGLWFIMRPLFHLFLAYNPGYGFAFGSFKSLFVVIIWIFYSLIVFLIGAEIASAVGRRETVFIRRLIMGGGRVPASFQGKYVLRYDAGSEVFCAGEPGDQMFYVLSGRVSIRKMDRTVATVGPGQYFGVVSFLLETDRTATAVAEEDLELAVISRRTVPHLIHESPEIVIAVLKEIAGRLRDMDRLIE